MQKLKTPRTQAIEWWNTLSEGEKQKYFLMYYAEYYTPAISHNQLTGREVQNIKEKLYTNDKSDNTSS